MRHRTPRARGQPLRAVRSRNVVRLFRPLGRNWTTRINSGRPTVRLPQTEAWAERERVPSGHNCRRQLATGRPEQIQEPGTAVPGTPIFANNAQRGGPPLESPCRVLSLVLSFASKESTIPLGAAAPPSAPESARQPPLGTASSKVDVHRYKHEAFLRTAIMRFTLPCLFAQTPSLPYHTPLPHQRACQSPMMQKTLP